MSDNFKTCDKAWQYCKKYGLDNITAAYSFDIAEALLRAYKDGANITSATHSDGRGRCCCPHYYNSDYCGYFKNGQCEHPRRR